jgi:hypothetical protein
MAVIIDEVNAQTTEPPAAAAAPSQRRPPPDMLRIIAELRREAEREQRLWCD